jgi:hypothetical protein
VAANLGVVIHTIDASGVASEAGRALEGRRQPDAARVAAISRGRHFTARDTASLLGVCGNRPPGARGDSSFQYRRYFDGYPWFGTASFVFWVLTQVLEVTLWRRLP